MLLHYVGLSSTKTYLQLLGCYSNCVYSYEKTSTLYEYRDGLNRTLHRQNGLIVATWTNTILESYWEISPSKCPIISNVRYGKCRSVWKGPITPYFRHHHWIGYYRAAETSRRVGPNQAARPKRGSPRLNEFTENEQRFS